MCVGLGNPGRQYALTRHNVGFMAIDAFASSYDFPDFKKKFQGEISERKLRAESCVLLKPLTYVNLSGLSVQAAMAFFKINPERIVVFHDDLDLAPGQVKVKRGGGTGGHNGLKSLDGAIGADYWRVRIGIGHPGARHLVTNHVLAPLPEAEREWLIATLKKLSFEFPNLLSETPDVWAKRLLP